MKVSTIKFQLRKNESAASKGVYSITWEICSVEV